MKERRLKPREQGDIGELSAMDWLASQGAHVYVPVGHSPDVDLIADIGGRLLRVEVKTSSYRNENGRWEIGIATRGGNQSWSGLVKHFEPDRCDYLFVLVGDGRRWLIPTEELECKTGLSLGGPKYSEFEVERGRPLPTEDAKTRLESGSSGEYRSGQPGHPVKVLALPSQVRILPPPSSSTGASQSAGTGRRKLAVGRTRVSSNHQVTIPRQPFDAAGIAVADNFRVEANGPGRITLIRVDEFARDRYGLKPQP